MDQSSVTRWQVQLEIRDKQIFIFGPILAEKDNFDLFRRNFFGWKFSKIDRLNFADFSVIALGPKTENKRWRWNEPSFFSSSNWAQVLAQEYFFFFYLNTDFYFCHIDGPARTCFLAPIPRPGVELMKIQLHLFWGTLIQDALLTERPQPQQLYPKTLNFPVNWPSRFPSKSITCL